MGVAVRTPEALLPHGAARERRAALEVLEAMLPTVLPEAAERSLMALARQAQIRPFRRHEQVLSQGRDPLLTMVLDGHLGAVRSDAGGRQQMITIAGSGELVGVISLRRDAPSVDLVGLSRGTAALWPGDLVMALARVDAGLAVGLLDHALRSAARLLNRLEHVTFDSVSRRLAAILWMRREILFDARRPLLSRPQLADLAGTSREMAGRVIRDFERRGLIARVGTTGLVLRDPIGLRTAAGVDEGDGRGPSHS
jgi:CRP-like cAMP-binding protein